VVSIAHGGSRTSALAAHMLESIGCGELVAPDGDDFVALAAQLAAEPGRRAAIAGRIRDAMQAGPGFLDPLAASDALGALLETAFDELAALGIGSFRAQCEPLRYFAPDDVVESIAAGEAALASGDI
jgi:predicted O-linked N-acetylglucosamine transferase (SPINDLY family)